MMAAIAASRATGEVVIHGAEAVRIPVSVKRPKVLLSAAISLSP